MTEPNWEMLRKPYDLRERLFQFACVIVRVVQFLHTRGPVGSALSYQLSKAGTSAGANYEEADDGSSPRDTLSKRRIVLRELKESRFRLRVLRHCELLTKEHDTVIAESDEGNSFLDAVRRGPFGRLAGGPVHTPNGLVRSADGMTVDSRGRVYVATRLGVEVLSPAGEHLGTIRIVGGTGPQNVAFAGRHKKTLFVVGARALWRLQMDAQGFIGRAK